ncbi:Retrovirus-related Pol polyprotein from transposon TNT 1-94 [Araneus ventricosus]|uniref:Retrovirus-related Pol polyprotein from transposon TNT 1-94 n=1 Tax=Araneus ventricosus TaxID=182803 RepID=A0A4Y2R6C3_ARAVE|nr:Retrovirus-related Pol polyprotein from transposon TNT 1-94 [Araneus ventricosus]
MLYIVSGYPLLDSVMYTSVDLNLIHKRLCHVNIPIIKDVYKNKSVKGLEKVNIKINNESCIACNVGKATRTSLKKNYVYKRVTKSVLDKVYMDLWGPAPVNSLGGSKYFLSIIDDFSRKIDVFTLKSKSEVFSIFKEYLSRVQRELGKKLKSVRTDNGMEFCHKDFETFLKDLGNKIERASFYTPELNGIAERFNRSSMEAVRTMLQDGGLQPRFWAEALHAYVHTKNRCSHKLTEGKTPMKIWLGHKPSIRHCRTFGSIAYVYVPTVNRNKLQPKAKIEILVGYAVNRRGYRVWLPKERKVVESIHVKIDETKNGVKTFVWHSIAETGFCAIKRKFPFHSSQKPKSILKILNKQRLLTNGSWLKNQRQSKKLAFWQNGEVKFAISLPFSYKRGLPNKPQIKTR